MTEIAALPDAWLGIIPPPASAPLERTPAAYVEIDASDLRQRILDLAARRKGEEWGAVRRAMRGERMFRIEGGEGDPEIPLVVGVDEWLSKRLIWPLAAELGESPPPPASVAACFAPSLAILRGDVSALGATSRWTVEHFEEKWLRASEKIETEQAGARDFTARLIASAAEGVERRSSDLPLVIQADDRYYALDDRTPPGVYIGPMKAVALRPMLRQLWGPRREIDTTNKDGTARAMLPAEIIDAYGRAVAVTVTEYAAQAPRVDDLVLVMPPRREPVEPLEDPAVAAWLETLDPSGRVLDWIAYCRPDRCASTTPALALIGGAHVGKSLLADGIARSVGARRATPLARVLGQFASSLAGGPILFSDEGLPRDRRTGIPQTEEFRALITSMDHMLESKGSDRSVMVRGGVRAILAANRIDRLFASKGNYSEHDVSALVRRLLVIEIEDNDQIARARARAVALGAREGDPARLERVARHLAWIQVTRECAAPAPGAGTVERVLRAGNDLAKRALDAIEDGIGSSVAWIALDPETVWIQTSAWARAVGEDHAHAIARAIAPYVSVQSAKRRTHPITKEPDPTSARWIGLSRARLILDGVGVPQT